MTALTGIMGILKIICALLLKIVNIFQVEYILLRIQQKLVFQSVNLPTMVTAKPLHVNLFVTQHLMGKIQLDYA